MRQLKNYIYLDKGYHKGVSEKLYEVVRQNKGFIVNIDEEGGVDYSDGSTLMGRYSKTLFNNANLSFLWGRKQFDLVKNNMSQENQVIVSGHPRFELLKPEFHFLYQVEVDSIKKRFNNFILINTNMGFGNNIRGDDFVKSNYGGRYKNIDQIMAFDKKKLEAYRSLILELSQQLNKTIILRPHPEEDHSFYLDAFKDQKNIHVVSQGSVVPWILAADFMIHPDCSTGIESLFLGKKPISYLPKDHPKDIVTHLPLEASECFISISDLISFIKKGPNSLSEVNLRSYPFAEEYFSMSKPITKLITDSLFQFFYESNYISEKKLPLGIRIKFILRKIQSMFQSGKQDTLIRRKLNGFTSNNIFPLSNAIKNYLPEVDRIIINKINKHLYCIYTK